MRAYKYRLYPTRKQRKRLQEQLGLAQEMYNLLLKRCKDHYKETGTSMTKYDLNSIIKEVKDKDERFYKLYSQVLQNIADRIIKAYHHFFRRVKERKQGKNVHVGFPRFKKYYKSITYPQYPGFGFKFLNHQRLQVTKIGNIPIVLHRLLKGNIKTMTIKQTKTNKWYACFSVEDNKSLRTVTHKSHEIPGESVGIDLGLTTFAVFSDGTMVEKPRHLIKAERGLKRLYRQLSRKKKESNNRRKARLRLARLHEKIAFQREEWLHKLSRDVVDRYGLIAVENLNVSGMLHNHHLAKHISDASWHQFIEMICYKAESAGSMVVSVNAKGTSQECCQCGTVVLKDLSVRVHDCPVCGLELDRDVNAAVTILNRGLCTAGLAGNNACGDNVRPVHQQSADKSAVVVEAGTICERNF